MHVLSPISVYRRSSYNTPSLFPRRQQVVLQKAYESYQRVPCWQSWYRYPLHIWRSFHEVFWTHCGHVRYHSIHILPLPHDSDSLVFITKMVFQQLVKTEFVFFWLGEPPFVGSKTAGGVSDPPQWSSAWLSNDDLMIDSPPWSHDMMVIHHWNFQEHSTTVEWDRGCHGMACWDVIAGILLGSRANMTWWSDYVAASQGERQPPQSGWFHPGTPDT